MMSLNEPLCCVRPLGARAQFHFLGITEHRIQAARHFYDGNVRDYRNRCESFPGNIVAGLFNFKSREFFNVAHAVRVAPSIAGSL